MERVGIGLEDLLEPDRARFLFALEEELHPNGETAGGGMGRHRAEVHHDARLVVAGAPPVEPPILLEGLEWPGLPLFDRPGRLDVVVGIEEDGGCSVRGRQLGEDSRMTGRRLEEPRSLETCFVEQTDDLLPGRAHQRRVVTVGTHRVHPDQRGEELSKPGHVGRDRGPEIVVHRSESTDAKMSTC